MIKRSVLTNAEGQYFCLPFGRDCSEWSPSPGRAHRWADRTACASAAFCLKRFRGLELKLRVCAEPLISC
ncbi:MAG: hypothetical protein ERJ69_06985 [Aphanocapsa feldmannii 288cV]|nr:MAG: hypothetical protein ERJ69_06985 [Aphanocapsa feldmannii 288cV]